MNRYDQPYQVFKTAAWPAQWKVGRFINDDNATLNFFRNKIDALNEAEKRNTQFCKSASCLPRNVIEVQS